MAHPLDFHLPRGAPTSEPATEEHSLSRSIIGEQASQDMEGSAPALHGKNNGEEGGDDERARLPKPRRAGEPVRIEPMIDRVGEQVRDNFMKFLTTYHEEPLSGSPDPDGDGLHNEPYYLGQIRRLNLGDHRSTTVYVDFSHVLRFDDMLAKTIVEYYQR